MRGLILFSVSYHFAHAVYQSYISLFYKSRGCSPGEIGVLWAAVAVTSMLANLFWGNLADRTGRTKKILTVLFLLSAGMMLGLQFSGAFFCILLFSAAFGFFYAPLHPLGDAEILRGLGKGGRGFGKVRLFGVVAFSASSFLFGLFEGNVFVPAAAAGLLLLATPSVRGLPKEEAQEKPSGKPMGELQKRPHGKAKGSPSVSTHRAVLSLEPLKDREFLKILLFTLPMQVSMSYYYAFFPTCFMALNGATGAWLGASQFVCAASQIPYLLVSDRIYARFGAKKTLLAAAALLAGRWALVAFSSGAVPAFLSQLLHGAGYTSVAVTLAKYAGERLPAAMSRSAQSMIALFECGLPRLIGNLPGGQFADAFGEQAGFLACTGLCVLAAVLFFRDMRREKC